MNKQKIKNSFKKSARSLINSAPILFGVILLISIFSVMLPDNFFSMLFSKISFFDAFIGAVLGSILAGNPVTSYILGGELINQGVSLIAVISFIVAWVTVGIVQLPAESLLLGKKFAVTRNFVSFLFSILVAVVTVLLIKIVPF